MPVVLASLAFPPDLLDQLPRGQVVSLLVKPVRLSNLEVALAFAIGHARQLQALSQEVDRLRQRVEVQGTFPCLPPEMEPPQG